MARDTPPTLVSYVGSTWSSNGTITTPSTSWLAGDVVVIMELVGNAGAIDTLTTTGGYTPTKRVANPASADSSVCEANVWADKVLSDGSGTFTAVDVANAHGLGVWVWRGSDGLGVNFLQNASAAKTVAKTPTDTHSAWCWGVSDWSASVNGGSVLTPAATHTRQNGVQLGLDYTIWLGDIADLASGASQSWGIGTGTSSTGPFAIAGIEILGTTSGPTDASGPGSVGQFETALRSEGWF